MRPPLLHLAMPRSLRARLLIGAGLWLAVAMAGSWLALTALFRDHLQQQVEATLATHLDQLLANLDFPADGPPTVRPLSDPRFAKPFSGLYWQIDRPDEPLRSRSLWDVALPLPQDHPGSGELHRHEILGPRDRPLLVVERIVQPPSGDPLRVAVAADRAELDRPAEQFGHALAASLAMVAAGILAAALAQVTLGLRPLGRLGAALARMRRGAAQRIEGTWPTEVQPLVGDFNAVLDHDAAVVARARTQAGNLAHALKTPLSVLRNRMQAADPALRSAVLEDIETMRRHVDHHLARARAAARTVGGSRTPVRARLSSLARVATLAHPDRAVSVTVQADDALLAPVEVQDFDEIAGNLLDNAVKWAGGAIRAAAESRDGGFVLTIEDDGPGLPVAARDRVFARGERLDEQTPGSGLGLAIVRDVVELYGGGVALDAGALGGLRVTVRLPDAA
ncbi:sensor histidine kinase [Azospirillum sp. TSO22-1]|uniref:sensor histidine kinase n=1 Tax=Azospirillum sp. TSO22-1 TaxID=716789 RepID=UPI000D649214|nr:sensor histidine kinase [Azospirillum sp. TSO22-1]